MDQVHVQALGNRPEKPVKIQIMGAPRENAMAKDSGWVSSRQVGCPQIANGEISLSVKVWSVVTCSSLASIAGPVGWTRG